MLNLPRFLIAENPMAEYGIEYVIHTQKPRFIAKRVYNENPETDFEIVQEIDDLGQFFGGNPLKMAKLMSRLGDWYVSYLRWEEGEDGEEEEGDIDIY